MQKSSVYNFSVKWVPMSPVNFTFIVISLLMLIHTSHSFYCTESFCEVETASYNRPFPDVRKCTRIGYRTFLDPGPCNCCEYCFDYLKEDDVCSVSSHQKPTEMCGPHLKCVLETPESQHAICEKIISGPGDLNSTDYCMRKRHEYQQDVEKGSVRIAQMNPECDSGGNYAPRQCLPGSVCYCSTSTGGRIFGLALPNEYQDCACARDIDRLTNEFGFTGKLPHCLPNGDYDELQCVIGGLIAILQISNNKKPDIHIFEPATPRYYIKDCELQLARIEVKIADAELENIKRIVADKPKCDPDGSYHRIQSEFNRLYCAAPNGTQIKNYEAEKFSAAAVNMNCYCARAKLLLWNSATGRPKCCSNGNYKPWQCIGSRCFCVDPLGVQDLNYEEKHEDNIRELGCYPKEFPEDGTEPECVYE